MNASTAPHVLVIDDDPDIRNLVVEYLGSNDLRVSAGDSGRETFEIIDREAIDLVPLDLKLPGEDGMQLARELRERATLPIILLTGRNEEADRVMGLELGADDYVTKPFSPRGAEVYDRTTDVQIRRRRLKIERDSATATVIVTERGEGYRLASAVETLY